jgi:hypothetical protein
MMILCRATVDRFASPTKSSRDLDPPYDLAHVVRTGFHVEPAWAEVADSARREFHVERVSRGGNQPPVPYLAVGAYTGGRGRFAMADETDVPDTDRSETERRPFQYSLKTLFALTAVVAILCSLVISSPISVAAVTALFLMTMVPAGLIAMLIYDRGYLRTFAAGALFPAVAILHWSPTFYSYMIFQFGTSSGPVRAGLKTDMDRMYLAISIVIGFGMILSAGLLAVFVRWLIESSRKPS